MTYCLGIKVREGLIALADGRITSGTQLASAHKMTLHGVDGMRFFVMTSGLRSLRDKILLYFEDAFARETLTRDRLFRVVNLYAQQVRRVADEDGDALHRAELRFNASTE